MESEKAERLERIKTKTKQLQDLILQQIAFKETYSFITREYVVLIFCNYFIWLCGKFCHFHIHFLCPEIPQIIYTENHCSKLRNISWTFLFLQRFNEYLCKSDTQLFKWRFSSKIDFHEELTWKPSARAAKVTKSYSRRIPSLEGFYRETKYPLLKSTHSFKNHKIKLRTFPRVSQVPQSKFEANWSRGPWVMIE